MEVAADRVADRLTECRLIVGFCHYSRLRAAGRRTPFGGVFDEKDEFGHSGA